jgi:hypothetical protein
VLTEPFLTSGCLEGAAAYGLAHPIRQRQLCGLVGRFFGGRCTGIERRRVAVRRRGRVSVSLFGSDGRYRIALLKGDVGYIAQGYGHSIENVGSGTARILIGFNAGIYETVTCRDGSRQVPKTCSSHILANRRKCSGNSRIATCSLPARTGAR